MKYLNRHGVADAVAFMNQSAESDPLGLDTTYHRRRPHTVLGNGLKSALLHLISRIVSLFTDRTAWLRLSVGVIYLGVAVSTLAEGRFELFDSMVELVEGGTIETSVILTDHHRITFVPPPRFTVNANKQLKKIILTGDNKVSIGIEITTNHLGGLPTEETLKKIVLQHYTGAAVIRSSSCRIGGKTGWSIDANRILGRGEMWMTRHVFVPWLAGTIEFTLTTEGQNFEAQRNIFGNLLNSFQVEPLKPKS